MSMETTVEDIYIRLLSRRYLRAGGIKVVVRYFDGVPIGIFSNITNGRGITQGKLEYWSKTCPR